MLNASRTVTVDTTSHSRATREGLPKRQRARRTNDPLAGLVMNTPRGRRIADLISAYLQALGNPTDAIRQAQVREAAELQVIAEEARTAALSGNGGFDLENVVRVQNVANRALNKLGIKPEAKSKPTLRETLMAARPS